MDSTPIPLRLEKDNDPRLLTSPLKFPGKLAVDILNNRLFISDSNHNRIVGSSYLSSMFFSLYGYFISLRIFKCMNCRKWLVSVASSCYDYPFWGMLLFWSYELTMGLLNNIKFEVQNALMIINKASYF